MANSDYKEHITSGERSRWDTLYSDYYNKHVGKGGTSNHPLGNGTTPGFSINDYTTAEKNKLKGIEDGALNNPHPATHPYTMITGLKSVSWTANYNELINRPVFPSAANGCDAATVNGIRITIGPSAPGNPKNNREVWFDTATRLTRIYTGSTWVSFCAVFG